MIDFSIVIPAYNEEGNITSSLTQVINFMKSYSTNYEVLVIDDGSKDKTAERVENYAKDHTTIRLIKNPHKGKGYAVRTGVLMSSGKYILMADADMATPIGEIKRLMVWIIDHNFDIAIASREGVGSRRNNEPIIRHIMGRVFNGIVRLLAVPGIQDTQCGFKLFKGSVARDIFESLILFGPETPDTTKPRVTAFDVEVLAIAVRRGYKIKEVPITWTYIETQRVSLIRDSLLNLWDVLRVKFNDLLGRYTKY